MSTVLDKPTFVFPEITEHTPIMVASRPGEPGIPAFVTKVKQSTVSAVAIMTGPGGGLTRMETCYHRDDPRIIERPAIFEEAHNGVFWISPLEMERRASIQRVRMMERTLSERMHEMERKQANELSAINSLLEEVVGRLSALEGGPAGEMRRGPGRPRKSTQTTDDV